MEYDVGLARDETGAWVAQVPAVPGCHTYGRSIQQALSRTREALSLWVDDAADADLRPQIRLTREERDITQRVSVARAHADRAHDDAHTALVDAVVRLSAAGFSRRDAATLLGLSHQRIQQLLDGS
jgi:predicted RNase H-like HicB family nuclease